MKTILLTSAGMQVADEIVKLFSKPPQEVRIAHIITASKPEASTLYVERDRERMKEIGFQVEDIDIEGKNENELRELLKNKDAAYIQGGNTFYLLKTVRESGFDRVIKDLIKQGLVYIGVSAGSYIACPTIEMAMWKHQDRNHFGLTDLRGLNLVPFLVSVHYKPEHEEILKREIATSKYPVKILSDTQAILIKDDKTRLVGRGEEIKLQPHG